MIASEYGYTLEQFGLMTEREIQIALNRIAKRTDNKHRLYASMLGHTTNQAKQSKYSKEKPYMSEQHKRAMKDALKNKFGGQLNGKI